MPCWIREASSSDRVQVLCTWAPQVVRSMIKGEEVTVLICIKGPALLIKARGVRPKQQPVRQAKAESCSKGSSRIC